MKRREAAGPRVAYVFVGVVVQLIWVVAFVDAQNYPIFDCQPLPPPPPANNVNQLRPGVRIHQPLQFI